MAETFLGNRNKDNCKITGVQNICVTGIAFEMWIYHRVFEIYWTANITKEELLRTIE